MFYAIDVIAGAVRPATVPAVKSPAATHWFISLSVTSRKITYSKVVPSPDPIAEASDSNIKKEYVENRILKFLIFRE